MAPGRSQAHINELSGAPPIYTLMQTASLWRVGKVQLSLSSGLGGDQSIKGCKFNNFAAFFLLFVFIYSNF